MGHQGKLHNRQLHDLYPSPETVKPVYKGTTCSQFYFLLLQGCSTSYEYFKLHLRYFTPMCTPYSSPSCVKGRHCFNHIISFAVVLRPNAGHGLLILEVSRSHTMTHHSRQDSSGRVISSSQRPLPDNTQHSQQINVHAPGGIRTHDLSRRAAVDLRLRPHDHWDRRFDHIICSICYF